MGKIRIISEKDTEKLVTMSMAIEKVGQAYAQSATGKAEVFPMVYHEFIPGKADMDIKSGQAQQDQVFGLKMLGWFEENSSKKLPEIQGTIVLADLADGTPKAVVNAGGITRFRTGAAGATGIRYLSRENSKILTVIGTGAQAPAQIAAAMLVRTGLESVRLCNPILPKEPAHRLADIQKEVKEILAKEGKEPICEIVPREDMEQAVRESDIIITVTPARTPYLKKDWVKKGTHLSCIGADLPGKEEIDPSLLAISRVFADNIQQSVTVGECEMAVKSGTFQQSEIVGEIGEVIAGMKEGRTGEEQITVFDSTGIILQDLLTAKKIYDVAEINNVGILAEF